MSEEQPGSLATTTADVAPPAPALGEIWIARSGGGEEVQVLLIEVHPEYVEALLCGDRYEWVTDTDAVLPPILTGMPERVLVHGDVAASILTRRLHEPVGRIEPQLAKRLALRGRGFDLGAKDLGRGTPIIAESDPRWEWKLEKHRQMRAVRARAAELGLAIQKLAP